MFRKSFLFVIFAAVAPLALSFTAYAQTTGPLAGTVVIQKEGKDEPVANALIEVYRTDIKGYYKTQTKKNGEFRFIGILHGEYVIAVSAPNAAPTVYPNVRAGQETIRIIMDPGDGRKYTEAEARQAVANSPKPGESASDGLTEEQKKANAEIDKKNAEITAKNEKIKNADAIAIKSNTEGYAALEAKNFDLAIAKFNEGIAAVPDFIGSTPILINGKMSALQDKGTKFYKEGAAASDPGLRKAKYQEANKLYEEALTGFQDALSIISRAGTATDPAELKKREVVKRNLYMVAADIHRIKVHADIDRSKIEEAKTVIAEYLTLENRPEIKLAFQVKYGDMFQAVGDLEKAIAIYRQILELKPDNADVMGKLGLSLFGLGAAMIPENKELEQEGLNYMQKYLDLAPVADTDTQAAKAFKKDIKDSVEYLTKTQKLTPQKPAGGKKKS